KVAIGWYNHPITVKVKTTNEKDTIYHLFIRSSSYLSQRLCPGRCGYLFGNDQDRAERKMARKSNHQSGLSWTFCSFWLFSDTRSQKNGCLSIPCSTRFG